MYPRRTAVSSKRSSTRSPIPQAELPSYMRREHVKGLLIRRFRSRFRGTRNPQFELAMTREVEELMKTKNLNQTHLSAAERKLKSLSVSVNLTALGTGKTSPRDPSVPHPPREGKGDNGSPQSRVEPGRKLLSKSFIGGGNGDQSVLPPIRQNEDQDQWAKIIENDLKKFAEEKRLATMRDREKRRKVKEDLLGQIQQKKNYKRQERQEDGKYDLQAKKIAESLEDAERKRILEKAEKIRKEKQLRDQQLKGNSG